MKKVMRKMILIAAAICMMAAFAVEAEAKTLSVYLPTKIVTTIKADGMKAEKSTVQYKNKVLANRKVSVKWDTVESVYTYNSKGIAVSEVRTNKMSQGTSISTYQFDQYGRMTSLSGYSKVNGKSVDKWASKNLYTDKMSGKTLKSCVCYSSNKIVKSEITYYTSGAAKGKEKSIVYYQKNEKSKYVKTEEEKFTYKLDSNKNVKTMVDKVVSYDGSETHKTTVTKTYTYKKYTLK